MCLKEKDAKVSAIESAAFKERRRLSKRLTSLESELSKSKRELSLLKSEQSFNMDRAVRLGKREERQLVTSHFQRQKCSSLKTLSNATRKAEVLVRST